MRSAPARRDRHLLRTLLCFRYLVREPTVTPSFRGRGRPTGRNAGRSDRPTLAAFALIAVNPVPAPAGRTRAILSLCPLVRCSITRLHHSHPFLGCTKKFPGKSRSTHSPQNWQPNTCGHFLSPILGLLARQSTGPSPSVTSPSMYKHVLQVFVRFGCMTSSAKYPLQFMSTQNHKARIGAAGLHALLR